MYIHWPSSNLVSSHVVANPTAQGGDLKRIKTILSIPGQFQGSEIDPLESSEGENR